MSRSVYSRKISSKEASKNFIFILKNGLSFFPTHGEKFELANGDLSREVKVESYPCICRGPEKLHEHYFISWNGLETGDEVEITKSSNNKYNLKLSN